MWIMSLGLHFAQSTGFFPTVHYTLHILEAFCIWKGYLGAKFHENKKKHRFWNLINFFQYMCNYMLKCFLEYFTFSSIIFSNKQEDDSLARWGIEKLHWFLCIMLVQENFLHQGNSKDPRYTHATKDMIQITYAILIAPSTKMCIQDSTTFQHAHISLMHWSEYKGYFLCTVYIFSNASFTGFFQAK